MTTQPSYRVPTDEAASLTGRLAEGLRAIRFDALPAPVVALSKHCLLDWFGVTLAGSRQPAAQIMRAEAQEVGLVGGRGALGDDP